MKIVNAKATLSESGKALLSSRDSARELLKLVIESQARPSGGGVATQTLHSSGMYILSERPKMPDKFSREV